MTAIETVRAIMEANSISLGELVEYADMGTKSNICQLLSRQNEVSQILSSEEVSV